MNTTTNTRGVSPCPECGGAGVYPKAAVVPPPPDVTCRKCQGSGRDYHVLSAQNTRGVSEAMVAELIAAGDFLAMNGTDGMVRRWERAKAALSAQPAAQGDAVATVHRMGNCVGQLVYCEFGLNSDLPHGTKLYTAPPAQPAERVPEGLLRKALSIAANIRTTDWLEAGGTVREQDALAAYLTASPAPSEGGKGVDGLCIRNPAPNAAAPSTALSPTATVYLNAKDAR